MHKNYDARWVKSYRSYTIADLCRIHHADKIHPQTIREWIKQSKLEAMTHGGDYYIYGANWKIRIKENNNCNKRKLAFREMRCEKCKFIGEALDGQVLELKISNSGGLEAQVVCRSCRHQNKRLYKRNEHQKIHKEFLVLHDMVGLLCDSAISPSKTHLVTKSNKAVCEPLRNPPPNTSISPNNTNQQQYNLWN